MAEKSLTSAKVTTEYGETIGVAPGDGWGVVVELWNQDGTLERRTMLKPETAHFLASALLTAEAYALKRQKR